MAGKKKEESAPAPAAKKRAIAGSERAAEAKAPAKRGKAAEEAAPPARRAKAAPVAEFDELSSLAQATKVVEDDIRAAEATGGNTWIKIIQPGSNMLIKSTPKAPNPDYIPGAQAGDWLIPGKDGGKPTARETLRATPVGMFKLYAEKKPGASDTEMDMTVSFWLPQDAEQIPLMDGNNFKRALANGNYLMPMHWLFVYIHDMPEIADALIPFQSVGNSYYTELMKMVKGNSVIAAELILDFTTEAKKNDNFNKIFYYPVAEIAGKNFDFSAETGKVTPCKGGAKGDVVREILTRTKELQENYTNLKLVTKRSPQALLTYVGAAGAAQPTARRGLPGAGKASYQAAEGEEEDTPHF
jgi:hypothetical protein